jgi:hypothetical protein
MFYVYLTGKDSRRQGGAEALGRCMTHPRVKVRLRVRAGCHPHPYPSPVCTEPWHNGRAETGEGLRNLRVEGELHAPLPFHPNNHPLPHKTGEVEGLAGLRGSGQER